MSHVELCSTILSFRVTSGLLCKTRVGPGLSGSLFSCLAFVDRQTLLCVICSFLSFLATQLQLPEGLDLRVYIVSPPSWHHW